VTETRKGTRAGWDEWALGIAFAIGPGPTGRADCTRRRVGAVIIEPNRHNIIGAGYNGTEPGGPSCLKGDCPRGKHYRLADPYRRVCANCGDSDDPDRVEQFCPECHWLFRCACGEEWPCSQSVPPGSSYDTGPGACIASHAEQNALASVTSPERLPGSTMYVTEEPCAGCVRQVRNTTGIAAIVWPDGRIDLRGRMPEG
jgi:dCMP deaminase